jgi:secreted trypsin-like serine protease
MVRVVGGERARIQNWPGQAMVRLMARKERVSYYLCGAAAINEEWVLSAAHCLASVKSDEDRTISHQGKRLSAVLEVVIGVDDLEQVKEENVYQVERVIIREDYKEASVSGRDIGLIQLKRPYTGAVSRLSLSRETDPQTPGAIVRVAGFGSANLGTGTTQFVSPDGEQLLVPS